MRTKTEQLGEGHKSSTFPANQGAPEPAAKPLDILTLVGQTMRKVQRLNICGRKLKIQSSKVTRVRLTFGSTHMKAFLAPRGVVHGLLQELGSRAVSTDEAASDHTGATLHSHGHEPEKSSTPTRRRSWRPLLG